MASTAVPRVYGHVIASIPTMNGAGNITFIGPREDRHLGHWHHAEALAEQEMSECQVSW